MQFKAPGKLSEGERMPQIFLLMRLTTILILAASLHVSAGGYAQGKISVTLKNVPLEKAFKAVLKESGYDFLGDLALLKQAKLVTLDLRDATLKEALDECFKGQPLTYEVKDRIIIVETVAEHSKSVLFNTNGKGIEGQVADEQGGMIAGATIIVKGTKQMVAADSKGHFVLYNLDSDAILVISCVGYETAEIPVNGRKFISIGLRRKSGPLDEVQVIAYGTTTQRLSTGDVSTVSGKEIEEQPVSNPLLALEGRVAGMVITQSTGLPGTGVTVQIRGKNSIANGNDPLYIIDGVPYTSQLLPSLSTILGTSGGVLGSSPGSISGSPLSYINPADIESISVLKDADATAIYGSRAANGAVLITTKRGKEGQMKVDVNAQTGWGKVTRFMKVMNTPQYLEMRHEAIANDGLTTQPSDYDINGTWDTTRNTDWQKMLIGGTAQYTSINGSVSGGTSNSQYFISGTYNRQTTVFPGNFDDHSGALHCNISSSSADKKFHLQLTASYMSDINHLQQIDLTGTAISLAPDAPPIYNPDGSINWAEENGFSTWPNYINPLAYQNQIFKRSTNNLIGNGTLSYAFTHNLEVKVSLGYTNMQMNEETTNPFSALDPSLWPYFQRTASFGNNNISSWIIEPQINYRRDIAKGRFNALIGTTINQSLSQGQGSIGYGYTSDLLLGSLQAASAVYPGGTTYDQYKYAAVFGRLSYDWQDKYLVNLTARRDGSSRFGPANQFHDFGSAGVGWIFSQEHLIKDAFKFLSFGKIRASYGSTGSDQINDYSFLDLYNPYNFGIPYLGTSSLVISNLFNPNLQWEETKKMEEGVEFGFLNDRILVNASYYSNRSSNQLLNNALPSITGFTSITGNLPATVSNYGWEILINTVNIKSKYFSWSSSLNLTIPKNKLVSFPNLSTSPYASTLVLGKPINIRKMYHFLGVNDTTGAYEFADIKGNPTSNPTFGTDNNVDVSTMPKFYGGLLNSFSYNGFELDILFQFTKQIGPNYLFGNFPGIPFTNEPVSVLSRWKMPGDMTDIQRYNSNYSLASQYNDARMSDAAISDASFIRLKNISVSWQMPAGWVKRMHFQNIRLYVHAQNLLTITKYIGMDPESLSTTSVPPLRIITMGVSVSL